MSEPNPPVNPSMSYATVPASSNAPSMSTLETLTGIFFEPGRTFESLRDRPRFLIAGLIIIAVTMAFTILLYQRIGFENMMRQAIENSPRTADMSPEQKEQIIQMQTGPVVKAISYLSPVIFLTILIAAGAALYLLGTMMMARSISYKQALSVWVYSSLPPTVLLMLANILLIFLKSPEDIDPATANRGLVRANPSVLIDSTAHPVLATAIGALDLFSIFGLFLAALGLRKVTRLSKEAAWGIVIAIWLIGVIIRIAMAAAFGSPMA